MNKIKVAILSDITRQMYNTLMGNSEDFPTDNIASAVEDAKTGFFMFELKTGETFQVKVEKVS